jgi:hypothetical protein
LNYVELSEVTKLIRNFISIKHIASCVGQAFLCWRANYQIQPLIACHELQIHWLACSIRPMFVGKTSDGRCFWKVNFWLVVWNMNFLTFHSVGNVIIPTDEVIFFRGVAQPPTRFRCLPIPPWKDITTMIST